MGAAGSAVPPPQGSHGHGKSWKNKFFWKVMENLQKVESHGKKFGLKNSSKILPKKFLKIILLF